MEKDEKIFGIITHEKPKNVNSDWDNHGRLVIHLVRRTEAGKIRNFSDSWEDRELTLFFPDLQLRTFYGVKKYEVELFGGFYMEYQPHTVNLEKAEKMARTLRTLGKKLVKLAETWGPAPDFGSYAQRFLKAAGAVGLLVQTNTRPGGWSYDDSDYREIPLAGVPALVVHIMEAYQEELNKRKTA